jgi:O-antigen ligase
MPTVVASILAAFNLRVVGKFEYLITNEGLRYRGIVSDPNYLSSILLVGFATCIACLKIKNGVFLKLFYSAVSGAFFFAIWLTQSRAGIYTAFLIVTVFLLFQAVEAIKNFKKIPKLMIMFSMALALMMFLMSSQSRITTLAKREGITLIRIYSLEALSPLLQNPIFGPGEAVFLKKYGQVAHNTIISIGLEYGIIGMVFMAIAIAYCFFNLWKYRERGSFIYFLPFLALNIVLCSFSGIGHKLLWFYLVRASTFHERVLCNDETNLATCSQ